MVAFRSKKAGVWNAMTFAESVAQTKGLAAELRRRGVGIDDRVVLLAAASPEWVVADFAIMSVGATTVPLATNQTQGLLRRVIEEVKPVLILSDDEALLDALEVPKAQRLLVKGRWEFSIEGEGTGPHPSAPDQSASILYTSGTTQDAKGVVLTHQNLAHQCETVATMLSLAKGDEQLFLLPLPHIFGRVVALVAAVSGVTTAFTDSFASAMEDVATLEPNILASVPRFFEKFREASMRAADAGGPVKRGVFDWAIRVGRAPISDSMSFLQRVERESAKQTILQPLRKKMGRRVRLLVSGGAPLDEDVYDFFAALGMPVLNGYGLTETTGPITLSTPTHHRRGSVGRAVDGANLSFGADGEIRVKGPMVMQRYFPSDVPAGSPRDPNEGMLSDDGTLSTGDLGKMDSDGFVYVTDRKKEVIVTAGGKKISPAKVEEVLRRSPNIELAMVVGEGERFLGALLVPSEALLKRVSDPAEIQGTLQLDVDLANRGLEPHERVRKFCFVQAPFSVATGELSGTLKLRRAVVAEKHRALLAELFVAT